MEIIIGSVTPIKSSVGKGKGIRGRLVEADVLNIRSPRRRKERPHNGLNQRRASKKAYDPTNGRVMTLMVPDGYELPKDVEYGDYRVFLKSVPKR